jgi:hypothetical protein
MVNNVQKIPFNEEGLVYYPSHWNKDAYKWVDNFVFEDELFIQSYTVSTRKLINFNAISVATGQKFTIMLPDLLEIMHKSILIRGKASGKWTFIKRGNHYGVKYAE